MRSLTFTVFLVLLIGSTAKAGVTTANVGSLGPVAVVELAENNPLYALEGITLNVYFRNVVRYEGVWSDVTNIVTCAKGSSDGTKWTYLPTAGDVGTSTFTLTVKQKASGLTLATKTASLVTRPVVYPSAAVSRKFLLIGDSTTIAGTVSAELFRLCDGDAKLTVTQVGSNTGTATDSTATPRSVAFDGITGTDFTRMWTNGDIAWTTLGCVDRIGSPFADTNTIVDGHFAFDFNYYETNQSISMAPGDWVVYNLGLNSIGPRTSDAELNSMIDREFLALTNMISGIQAVVPGIRIGICITIPPNEDINAFISDYGVSSMWIYRYLRNHQLWVERLIALLDGTMPNVYLVPIHVNLDCANNLSNSGVHPNATGLFQIASSYRMFLKGVE